MCIHALRIYISRMRITRDIVCIWTDVYVSTISDTDLSKSILVLRE